NAHQLVLPDASAGDFDYRFTDPGSYIVLVPATAQGGGQVSAQSKVEADYKATVPAQCPTVVATGEQCQPTTVPVRPGVKSGSLSAHRTPRAGEPGSGKLVLLDPSGSEVASQALASNEAKIDLPA